MSQSGLIVKPGGCRLGGGGDLGWARQSPEAALLRGSPGARTAPLAQGNPVALSQPRLPAANSARAPLPAPRQALGLACLTDPKATECAKAPAPLALTKASLGAFLTGAILLGSIFSSGSSTTEIELQAASTSVWLHPCGGWKAVLACSSPAWAASQPPAPTCVGLATLGPWRL